jgi:hypothetical protein
MNFLCPKPTNTMRELAEFRIDERFAPMLFAESEGKRFGNSVRKIELDTDDPRFKRIGELQKELMKSYGKPFFYGWEIIRKYGARELANAELFYMRITSIFEPAGEECGTKYDESVACRTCGAGAKQIGPLRLDVSRIPKGKDFAKSISGEIVVSQRAVDIFNRNGVTGVGFSPVRTTRPAAVESKDWYQLHVQSTNAIIASSTRTGNGPFDDDPNNEYRCAAGDLIGLNLLSEVTVDSASRGDADIIASRQYIGTRRGLLRPERIIFTSKKVFRLFDSESLKGCDFEIAKLE